MMPHTREAPALAIIGIGCRFPGGATDPAAFWKLLCDGVDAIGDIPSDRFDVGDYYDADPARPGRMAVRWGGYVDGIQQFDADFFGISPREAARVDPQHRLLMESVWEALEDAGQDADALVGSATGVFVGLSSHDYGNMLTYPDHRDSIDAHVGVGNAMSIAANRISHFFAFRGPSLVVDTACSSSLVAAHLACRSLISGECRLAIAAGANVLLTPESTLSIAKAGMLSPDGRCKAFDVRANGYVRSEGAGVVIIKPLARAIEDGDRVHAVIRATAANHDGRTVAMAVPGRDSQQALIEEALREAQINPSDVQYVEAHGTGTPVGDPIEAGAIGAALARGRDGASPCIVGSVKTNIGHLEAASGMAGLIKATLALEHRQIPPSLHFTQPNPAIDFEALRLRVATALEPWPTGDRAIAGVNSFGFGGANAHVILERAPKRNGSRRATRPRVEILPLSAKSDAALHELSRRFQEAMRRLPADSLRDACYTAAARRTHHSHRAALVGDRDELVAQLDGWTRSDSDAAPIVGDGSGPARVVFVFTGMGPLWWGMGRQLLEDEPVFGDVLQRCDDLLRPMAGWSLLEELARDETHSRVNHADLAQVTNLAIQAGLAAVWRSWGIEPDAVIGHSAGETAAAYVAGALTLEDALRVAFHRGRLQHRTAGSGRMLAVGLAADAAAEAVRAFEDRISIAAINSPGAVTLSGDCTALDELAAGLTRQEVFCRHLHVDVPYHGPQMDRIHRDLLDALENVTPAAPRIPFLSSTLGTWIDGVPLDAQYWWRNIREPVQFSSAVSRLLVDGYDLFLEVGPHPVLAGSIAECAAGMRRSITVLPSLRRMEDERTVMLRSLAVLYVKGCPIRWRHIYPDGEHVALPHYPWQRERHWFEPPAGSSRVPGLDTGHPLLGWRLRTVRPTFEADPADSRLSYLSGHTVQADVVFPAAAYVEMAVAAAAALEPDASIAIGSMAFRRMLVIDPHEPTALQFVYDPGDRSFEIHSAPKATRASWVLHATGRLKPPSPAPQRVVDLEAIKARCSTPVATDAAYDALAARGLVYKGAFRAMTDLWRGPGEALGRVTSPLSSDETYYLHPALLDAAFHVLVCAAPEHERNASPGAYVVASIDRIEFHCRPAPTAWSHAVVRSATPDVIEADVELLNDDGMVSASVIGLRSRHVKETRAHRGESVDDWMYRVHWDEAPLPPAIGGRSAPARTPADICRTIAAQRTRLQAEWNESQYDRTAEDMLNAIAASYARSALGALAWPDAAAVTSALARQAGVRPSKVLLFRRLVEIVRQHATAPVDSSARSALCEEFREAYPANRVGLDMLMRCGEQLAGVLRGDVDAVELVFASDALPLWERFFDQPWYRFHNGIAADVVELAVQRCGGSARILEIGGGTGATTAMIAPRLPTGARLHFTDVSPFFLGYAKRRFSGSSNIDYTLLDIEADPTEQGFAAHTFDVVVAANVLHATKDLRATAGHIGRLLAAGGVLVVLEGTRRQPYFDVIFGVTDGWWRFEDHDVRPDHPLLAGDEWCDVLGRAGFDGARAVPADVTSMQPPLSVILAGAPAEPAADTRRGTWLLFADGQNVAVQVREQLSAAGDRIVTVNTGEAFRRTTENSFEIVPGDAAHLAAVLDAARQDGVEPDRILHSWSLDAPASDQMSPAALVAAQSLTCDSIVSIVRAFDDRGVPLPKLWIVTAGAQSCEDGASVAVVQAPAIGMARVLRNERPEVQTRLIDLGVQCDRGEVSALVRELRADDAEEEVALRGTRRLVRRLKRTSPADDATAMAAEVSAESTPFRLEIGSPGSLETLTLRQHRIPALGPDEVLIRVLAAGLNFRDVMLALGMLPSEAFRGGEDRLQLGTECAGIVIACGERVTDLRPGDEVVSVGTGTFGSQIRALAALTAPKPPHLTFEEAATIPATFMTAEYALAEIARLAPGERLLIHAATGGVGLAAIQVARRAGAEIFATAGTPEKRAYLASLGIGHVFDSRSLAFADEILERTGGEGVDVILNSLTGDAIPKGLSILRPYGRFLEIGKRDIYQNSSLGMLAFNRNLSFTSVALDQLCQERPVAAGRILRRIVELVRDRQLDPLPHADFDFAEAEEAFRLLAQARHLGKVVLSLREPRYRVGRGDRSLFAGDATYLITGGLGGFGLAVAQWMAASGAGNIVLMGRSSTPLPENAPAFEALRQSGARVSVVRGDVSREEDVARVLGEIRGSHPALKGVIHAAVVVDDAPFGAQDAERVRRVLAPKAAGAWNLHRQTLDADLDFFVAFSSASSVFGAPGQANYSAANAFLDALAAYRRARGLPACTINWGWLSGTGYASRRTDIEERLARQQLEPFTPQQAIATLDAVMRCSFPQVVAMRQNWRAWSQADQVLPGMKRSRFLEAFEQRPENRSGPEREATDPVLQRLADAPPEGRRAILEDYVVRKVARVLGSAPAKIDPQRPLTTMGLDSLMAVELQVTLNMDLRIQIAIVKLVQGLSVSRLTDAILEQLQAVLPAGPAISGGQNTAAPEPVPDQPQRSAVMSEPPAETASSTASVAASTDEPPGAAPPSHAGYYATLDYSRWSRRQRFVQKLLQAGLRLGARVEIEGLDHMPASGPFILAANHLSLLDAPVFASFLQRRTVLVAAERWKTVPLVNRALDFVDAIYVRRGEGDWEAIGHALTVLRAGGVLGLSPEGRISADGALAPAHTGVAYLAAEAEVPVLPVAVYGQEQISRNIARLRRTRVHVRIGRPLAFPRGERTAAKLRADTERVMNAVAALLPQGYRGRYQ